VTGTGVDEIGYFPRQAAKHQVGALESALEMAEISAGYGKFGYQYTELVMPILVQRKASHL
jgi:hypothetical protein